MQATLNGLMRLYVYVCVCVTTVVEEESAVNLGGSWGRGTKEEREEK